MLAVSELYIYPVKSLGGFSVPAATITDRGFEYDRRWMLVDENNRFLTQREIPLMALLQAQLADNVLRVYHKIAGHAINIPLIPQTGKTASVQIWDDTCTVQLVSTQADHWFSDILSIRCRLVYMPSATKRMVNENYALQNEITSLSDGYPFLIIGQASLDELNSRLAEPLPIDRFRPNIVFIGGEAFEEDLMEHFTINGIDFYAVKPCARCMITTINQDSAAQSKEPLRTLARYHSHDHKVYFGQNLLHKGDGVVKVGDVITIEKKKAIRNFTTGVSQS